MARPEQSASIDQPAAPATRMRTVAIVGASGYVGGRLLDAMIGSGRFSVRAIARTPSKLMQAKAESGGRLTVCRGDVSESDSLEEALRGAEAAYYLVHSMGSGPRFHETDLQGARNFGAACAAAGVGRIIYLSGLGADDEDLSEHLSSRHATGAALRESGLPVTELRAAIIVGSGSASFEIIRDLSHKLPVMVTPRWVRSRCEPIGIRDVIAYLIGVLDEPRSLGETLEIGGGDVLSYAEMMRVCATEQGRRCRILTVPVLTPRLSSYWLHLVTSVDMSIARPLIDGLRNDVVCTDTRIRGWIPLQLADYRTSVQRAIVREQTRTHRESRWTDATRPTRRSAAGARVTPNKSRFSDVRNFDSALTPEQAYARISRIGGDFGYGSTANFFWRLRGAMDRVTGGPGLRRGRPFGADLFDGDVVDFWRVEKSWPPRLLRLVAEMWVPGRAELEYRVEPRGDGGARVVQTATLTNEGLLSGIYWYAVKPVHNVVFDRLGRHLLDD